MFVSLCLTHEELADDDPVIIPFKVNNGIFIAIIYDYTIYYIWYNHRVTVRLLFVLREVYSVL